MDNYSPSDLAHHSSLNTHHSVGIVIVSHSARLAEGVAELAREMAGPDVRLAAVGGLPLPDRPLGTDVESIRQAIEQVYSDAGVLVLMDLGSALLSAEMALDLIPAEWRERVVLCDAPLTEGAVAAAVQARLGAPLEQIIVEARGALAPKVDHLGAPVHPVSATPAPETPPGQNHVRFTVRNRLGIHARPAARLVQAAGRFQSDIRLTNLTRGGAPVSAKSITDVALLGAEQGHEILVTAVGPDANEALAAISNLAQEKFGDPDDTPAPNSPLHLRWRGAGGEAKPGPLTPLIPSEPSTSELRGVPASPGIAIGKALHLQSPALTAPEQRVDDPGPEWARLTAALAKTRAHLESSRDLLIRRGDEDVAGIFEALALFLEDEALLEPARHLVFDEHVDAASAWQRAAQTIVARYQSLQDDYLRARAADVADVAQQVLAALLGHDSLLPGLDQPCILVTTDLEPAIVARLDPSLALGICAAHGGPTSHGAILARTLGIPAVVGLGQEILGVPDGAALTVDGTDGTVWINPDQSVTARYVAKAAADRAAAAASRTASAFPAVTRDGQRVVVFANVGSASDARAAVHEGADGVGLFRTEFLFLDRESRPDEGEQLAAYLSIVKAMEGRSVVIRTLDVGGDKPLPYVDVAAESNPFMGVRGIRFCLANPELFLTQLHAIVRVASSHPIKVMFPMIATLDEFRKARRLIDEARSTVQSRGQPVPDRIETGIMVEVPATALHAEQFAAEVDFFSIGTNDLSQYTFAADRGNPRVAGLADAFEPTVLRLIGDVARAANARGKPVAVCGEMAGDPLAAPLLIGLGVDELSVNPSAIPLVKQAIRRVDSSRAQELARKALKLATASEVRALAAELADDKAV